MDTDRGRKVGGSGEGAARKSGEAGSTVKHLAGWAGTQGFVSTWMYRMHRIGIVGECV
jgi:hypothetical protein